MEQKNLVIVESPAKAKTIKKYLGKNFEVLASYGHVRDLVPKEGAVDPKRKFAMRYQILEKNEKHVHAIARALKKSDALYLATDPDREGEAISWHLVELLKELDVLDGKDVHRVVFYEITRNAIREAISQPRAISQDLVNAQQARRALDYLVGFNLSPLLWKKAGLPGASAGRVQSPALRMICEREEEIARFKAREYWTVDADVEKAQQTFPARLIEYRGEKVEQFTVTNEQQAAEVRAAIEAAAAGKLSVSAIERKQRRRNPAPPFTTSTLQQEVGAQARLRRAAHDAPRAAAVRRRRLRRRRSRPHHVHAHGLGEPRERGRAGNPPGHRRELRPGVAARVAARLQDQVEERAGSARSDPADLRRDHAGAARRQDRRRSVQALQPDLEARGRQPDGAGGLRHRGRGSGAGQRREARRRCGGVARQRLDAREARLHRRI